MQSIVILKRHTVVLVGSCGTVDPMSPCQLPYSQIIFKQKMSGINPVELYQTDRKQSR